MARRRCGTAPRTSPRPRARPHATAAPVARRPARRRRRVASTIGSTMTYGFHGSRNHSSPARSSNHTRPTAAPHAAVRRPMRSTSTTIVAMHAASTHETREDHRQPGVLAEQQVRGHVGVEEHGPRMVEPEPRVRAEEALCPRRLLHRELLDRVVEARHEVSGAYDDDDRDHGQRQHRVRRRMVPNAARGASTTGLRPLHVALRLRRHRFAGLVERSGLRARHRGTVPFGSAAPAARQVQ